MPALLNALRSIDDSGELSSLLPPVLQDSRISKENVNASATFLRILQARVVFDGCLGFRGTTNLHRQEEGHLFEWGACWRQCSSRLEQNLSCHSVFTELGETRNLTSRQGKRGFTESSANPTRKPLWALNLRPSFNDNFVDIQRSRGEQRLLATSINSAARKSLLRCATCLPILDAARWWTRTTISRVKMRPETMDGRMPCTQEGQWSCRLGDSQGASRFQGQ